LSERRKIVTRRRITAPPRPDCAPIGGRARPTLGERACRFCPASLHPVAVAPQHRGRLDDWTYVDEQDRHHIDSTPPELTADPKGWWDNLAKANILAYSSLKVRFDLGGSPFIHMHVPGDRIGGHVHVDPPFCCGSPMYAGADGWFCRVARTRIDYTTTEEQ
jgi:hypothetical protein